MFNEATRRVNVFSRSFRLYDYDMFSVKPLMASIPCRFDPTRRSSQKFASLPVNYCFGVTNELYVDDPIDALFSSSYNDSSWSSNSHRTQSPISEIKYLRSRSSEPRLEGFRHPPVDCDECFPGEGSSMGSRDSGFSARKFLPKIPVKRNLTHSGFFSNFATIPSVDSESQLSLAIDEDSSFGSTNMLMKSCTLSEGQSNENHHKKLLNRSHSLIADDQIIDVEYDSDTGWQKTNVRRNPFNRESKHERRESLKLHLKSDRKSKMSRRQSRSLTREEHVESSDTDTKPRVESDDEKLKLEGRVVSPKMVDDLIKPNDLPDKTDRVDEAKPSKAESSSKNAFERCSRGSVESKEEIHKSDDGELADDVFDSALAKSRDAPLTDKKKNKKHNASRRSSSLEVRPKAKSKKKSVGSRSSSVSIKDEPEIIDDERLSNSSHNASSHAIAKPTRGSLKKSSTPRSSDYDRDRGRSRHMDSAHRESFKKNARTNERGMSDQERDASDRELKDSLNRSLSNTDTHLEDRIGEWRVAVHSHHPLTSAQIELAF